MRAGSAVLGLAVIICSGLTIFTFQVWHSKADLEARRILTIERQAGFRAALRHIEQTKGPRTATASPAEPAAVNAVTASRPASPASDPGLMDLARDNPQLLNLFIADRRSRLQQRYGVLFQILGLATAQREQFKDIIGAEVARSTDISAAASAQGLEYTDPAVRKLRADSQQRMQSELIALLGERGYHEFKEFGRTEMVRNLVGGFAVQVASDVPVTPSQAEQLVRALAAASPSYQKGDAAKTTDADWASVDRIAEAILAPAQFTAWKSGVERLDAELKMAYDAARANSGRPAFH